MDMWRTSNRSLSISDWLLGTSLRKNRLSPVDAFQEAACAASYNLVSTSLLHRMWPRFLSCRGSRPALSDNNYWRRTARGLEDCSHTGFADVHDGTLLMTFTLNCADTKSMEQRPIQCTKPSLSKMKATSRAAKF